MADDDTGYGSPEIGDAGYGSPWTLGGYEAPGDTGYGSPYVEAAFVEVFPAGVWPDDGGVMVALRGDWPASGPYRVRLVDVDGALYPLADYCHGGVPGSGSSIYARGPADAWDEVRFVLPPAPPGLYDVRVEWGVGWSHDVTVPGLRIVHRTRHPAVYRMRSGIPSTLAAGARSLADEPRIVSLSP